MPDRSGPGPSHPRPLFVLGKHRSGTTWLANQLAAHSRVAAVVHPRHGGVHESGYFAYLHGRFGPLGDRANFDRLIDALARSDYLRLAQVEPEDLAGLWPTRYEALFRNFMDRFARRRQAAYWLEKTPSHSLIAPKLARWYPDARFVIVHRDLESVVASTVRHEGAAGSRVFILRVVFGWIYYRRRLRSFARRTDRAIELDYSEMTSDLRSILQKLCRFLGLEFEESMLEQRFEANTSFSPSEDRASALSPSDRWLIRIARTGFSILPGIAMHAMMVARRRSPPPLPGWFFADPSDTRAT